MSSTPGNIQFISSSQHGFSDDSKSRGVTRPSFPVPAANYFFADALPPSRQPRLCASKKQTPFNRLRA